MKRKEEEEDWQIAFNSLMLIVLTFMIVLCALSTIKEDKVMLALGSLRKFIGTSPEELKRIAEKRKEIMEAIKELEELGDLGDIEIQETPEAIIVDIKSPVLFEIGRAELKEEAYVVLNQVRKLAKKVKPPEIEVAGFTCDLPINTRKFRSNWELSIGRALSTVKFMEKKLEGMKLNAVGYGEYRPDVPNTDEANRKLNRRVEIYLRYGKKR